MGGEEQERLKQRTDDLREKLGKSLRETARLRKEHQMEKTRLMREKQELEKRIWQKEQIKKIKQEQKQKRPKNQKEEVLQVLGRMPDYRGTGLEVEQKWKTRRRNVPRDRTRFL